MTGYWLILFIIMTGCSWGSYPFPKSSTAGFILGTIIPIVIPILGTKLMPNVIEYLKSNSLPHEQQHEQN
jgi:hypothetical protein